MNDVQNSGAFFLMLTRQTLERPVVLAELCAAHAKEGMPIVPIRVEWPDGSKNGRDFRHPMDLDEVRAQSSSSSSSSAAAAAAAAL